MKMRVVFIETANFSANLPKYMTDEEFSDFQQFLSKNPNFGDVIPGSYGLRKVRWAGKAKGKRGGLGSSILIDLQMEKFGW